jgi:hypothetical protein
LNDLPLEGMPSELPVRRVAPKEPAELMHGQDRAFASVVCHRKELGSCAVALGSASELYAVKSLSAHMRLKCGLRGKADALLSPKLRRFQF